MYDSKFNNRGRFLANKLKYEGSRYNTSGGWCTIEEYRSANDVLITFDDGYISSYQLKNILSGSVRNPYHERFKLYGEGICDISSVDFPKEYRTWCNLLARTIGNNKAKCYEEATICDDWKIFSKFKEDYQNMFGYKNAITEGWQLDKDILFRGNKHYSKDTCCLVPRKINNVLITKRCDTETGIAGVHFCRRKNKYIAQLVKYGKKTYLGSFKSKEDALNMYVNEKKKYVREFVQPYIGVIEDRVFKALITWEPVL